MLISEDQSYSYEAAHVAGGVPRSDRPQRRVLQLLHSPDPGGVLALAQSIERGIAPQGFDMETLFLTSKPNLSARDKITGSLAAAGRILRGKHDVVMAYQALPSIVIGLAGLLARSPKVIVHQTTVASETWAPVRWLSAALGWLGLYHANIVNTAYTRSLYDKYLPRYRRHLQLIEHGVETPRVTQPRDVTLQRYCIPDDGQILVNTGRLVDQKNQDVLIRALASLPGCRLVVAGEGERRAEWTALAAELGVADRVHLLGALPHDEALQLYGAADLFVFPSVHETFGISAVEAVLLGVPTLVGDIQVLREVLTINGESCAAFINPRDVDAWVQHLRSWCEQPPERSKLQAFAARLARRYSEERMVQAYVDLLNAPGR